MASIIIYLITVYIIVITFAVQENETFPGSIAVIIVLFSPIALPILIGIVIHNSLK
jgi:hypothetical protein